MDNTIEVEIRIPVPCGAHMEIKKFTKDGFQSSVERINDLPCEYAWCVLNTDEWKTNPKYIWIFARMRELGWDGKSPCSEWYKKALSEWYEKL